MYINFPLVKPLEQAVHNGKGGGMACRDMNYYLPLPSRDTRYEVRRPVLVTRLSFYLYLYLPPLIMLMSAGAGGAEISRRDGITLARSLAGINPRAFQSQSLTMR